MGRSCDTLSARHTHIPLRKKRKKRKKSKPAGQGHFSTAEEPAE